MSADLLGLLILIQIWIVVVLFAFLLWNRLGREWRERREQAQVEKFSAALNRWRGGEISDEELGETLDEIKVRPAWESLQIEWIEMTDERRYRFRELVRTSGWFRRVESSARSLFWWRRIDGAQILGYLAKREDSPLLEELLKDRRPLVRMAAVFSARDLKFPELREPLLTQAIEAPFTRRKAYEDALLSYGEELIPLMEGRLRESSDTDELSILLELARTLPERTERASSLIHSITPFTTHDALEVRIRAAAAMGAYPDSESVPILHGALRDSAWQVRAQAARSLGRLGAAESRHELRRLLSDPHWWVRLRAGVALRNLGGPGDDVLRTVQEEDDPFAHDMSQYVLRLDDRALTTYEA